ncbi:winged helix DNA-binding domain-containing protein [Promicromonospora sp. MS192]|uniref:winged helix DNA-binding domain-containing protein n=1 Tax=Promicromonospora sp. MS192 TaxID=3412684 RepID=UPI003C309605
MTSGPLTIPAPAARRLRLRAQGLTPGGDDGADRSPVDVVRRMVALQGQDLPAVLRAIAVRSAPGTTVEDVRARFDAGELVRGWTQRGTLFATTPGDLAALVSLTAERMARAGARTQAAEGLDDAVVARAGSVAREALSAPGPGVSRAALLDLWRAAGVPVEGQRGYHLIVALALQGVLHWGPFAGAQQLMVATPPPTTPEEPDTALRRIALSYVTSRGPATPEDLAWWLGLPKVPVRAAVAALREEQPDALVEVTVDGRAMLAGRDALGTTDDLPAGPGVVLVPGFDEIVLGYQDRELVADAEAMRTVVPFTNGIFRPAVLLDGRLVGTWRRAPKRDEEPVELVPGVPARSRRAIEKAVAAWPHG